MRFDFQTNVLIAIMSIPGYKKPGSNHQRTYLVFAVVAYLNEDFLLAQLEYQILDGFL